MARGPRLQVAGIPVRIEPTFFLVLVLLGLPQPWFHVVSWVVIATASVLLHELGHAVAFRAYGVKPSSCSSTDAVAMTTQLTTWNHG